MLELEESVRIMCSYSFHKFSVFMLVNSFGTVKPVLTYIEGKRFSYNTREGIRDRRLP